MHNLLMIGPPGAGKTMIAQRIPTILPPMCREEQLELARIYSVSGMLMHDYDSMRRRPFRSPHHTITPQGLTGGGTLPKPGEISLAHKGVLFLDELAEFPRQTIEVLRQPLEEGVVNVSRLDGNYRFPARCQLIAATNIATTKLIQWETAEKPENKAFHGFCGFIFSLFEPFFCRGSSSVF